MCQPALQAGNSNVIADGDAMVWVEREEEAHGARLAESCCNDSLLSFCYHLLRGELVAKGLCHEGDMSLTFV